MLLEDNVAIITGAAMVMGKGTALKFAREGCIVAISDITMDGAFVCNQSTTSDSTVTTEKPNIIRGGY